jgi:hypothetical protein
LGGANAPWGESAQVYQVYHEVKRFWMGRAYPSVQEVAKLIWYLI